MTDTCATCHYWVHIDSNEGKCLRYPPTPLIDPATMTIIQAWPILREDAICGEWTPNGYGNGDKVQSKPSGDVSHRIG